MPLGWKILAGILLLVGLVAVEKEWERHIYQQGYDAAGASWKKREADMKADAEARRAASLEDANRRTLRLSNEMADRALNLYQENQNAEKTLAALRADARALRLRLSVAVDPGSLCGERAAADTATATGAGGEARADLVPAVADAVLGIAGDIAKGVRERNALIDAYNAARETCNTVTAP